MLYRVKPRQEQERKGKKQRKRKGQRCSLGNEGQRKATGQSEVPDAVWDRDQLKHGRKPQRRGAGRVFYTCVEKPCV